MNKKILVFLIGSILLIMGFSNPHFLQAATAISVEEMTGIKMLVYASLHASSGSMEEYLVDQKLLESDDLKTELAVQTQFILSVYNDLYADEARKRLTNVSEMIDEDRMILTFEQLITLLEMAGAKPSAELKSYDYLRQWEENGYYKIPIHHYGSGETFVQIDFNKIEKMDDSRVIVHAVLSLEYDYGPVETFKIILSPNTESIFQYSVESIRAELIHPDGAGIIGKDASLKQPYVKPKNMTDNPLDYIFELDSALYQMPFPAGELENNGWKIEEEGSLEAGGRKKVHAQKKDSVLTLGLWNYNTISSELKDCQVVWLKTGRDKAWNTTKFKLAEGVQSGKRKTEVESIYHDYLNGAYTSYSRMDPLYKNVYGYSLHFKNGLIDGFQMGYAPTSVNRQKRIQMMTDDWEQMPETEMASGEDFEMIMNHIYKVDIDGDGKKEEICVKQLEGIKWADYLCVFINREINYVVRGEATDLLSCKSMKMKVEDGKYFYIFEGEDYVEGSGVYRKIRVEKGWSREVRFDS